MAIEQSDGQTRGQSTVPEYPDRDTIAEDVTTRTDIEQTEWALRYWFKIKIDRQAAEA